ncbi:steroid receptor RNA activator 1 [Nasonia vitripennis]|uniref:SRA1/Sec31 domain-containing protein n=1 Tax=Nasonia vitripennis TaxID=7425 RepID=A0A7M7G6P8_NASVI|nr:steroid receptor RNA activator 1 [Nasonia vitripennis]
MEGNSEEAVSTQKSLLASHDPGWNDPPSWAFTGSPKPATATPTKRNLLNKRVAFPLNSKPESTTSTTSNLNMPPMGNIPPPVDIGGLTSAPHKPMVEPTGANSLDTSSEIEINKESALKDTLDNLKCSLERLDSGKAEEIKKRLERMETMWNEDKLNSAIHKKLSDISNALKEEDVEKADQIHISLMMNYATLCSSWIPGIRQLITEIKSKKI